MDYSQFLALKQEIALFIAFLVVFLYDTFSNAKSAKGVPYVALLFMVAVTAFGFCPMCKADVSAFSGMYASSATIAAIKNILNVGALIVLIQSVKWANSEFVAIRRGEFYELILLTLLGMYFMISSRHFLMFIIGLETASLPLCALVAFDKNRYESHEAAIKYVLTAVFSSAILLMGLSYVYALTGTLYYDMMALTMRSNLGAMLVVGLAFVMAGFGFKLSLVPFHLWTADVYQGAPTSVTSYLSVISKGSAAFAFLVVLTQVFGTVYSQAWEWMLYALIILTITIGNLFAMFYVLVYVFSNLAAFGVIGAIENATGKVNMTDYNALYRTNPRLAFTMMLAMFSLAGIPPFAGFFSKFFVFTSALNGTNSVALYVLVLIALINTIISLYYYLLVVKAMFINPSDTPIATFRSACSERLGMWVCVAGIIGLGIVSYFYDYLLNVVA